MNAHFEDYYWDKGNPIGIRKIAIPYEVPTSFKIVKDPYGKRMSLEKYEHGKFCILVYDSVLLDFRKLNPVEQHAWQKDTISETPNEIEILIRNIDDRIILREKHLFENQQPRQCKIFSVHGIHLATQYIYYEKFGDSFNGSKLFDCEEHPIVQKTYSLDGEGRFHELLSEKWSFKI
jgi:hypothetical protein